METTWLPRHARVRKPAPFAGSRESLERETGFEPATSTLARSHSTAELLPLVLSIIAKHFPLEQWPRCVEAQANDDQVPFAGTDTADDCHSEWRSDESVVPCFRPKAGFSPGRNHNGAANSSDTPQGHAWSADQRRIHSARRCPLRVQLWRDDLAVAQVNDAVAVLGRLWVVGDHQHSLS